MRFLFILLATLTPLAAGKANTIPNIIFILADDLGITDINAFASQLCSPTRAVILTGRIASPFKHRPMTSPTSQRRSN